MFNQEKIFKNYIKRLQEKISTWDGEKVLLYGAGVHSKSVMENTEWRGVDFLGFSDRSDQSQENGFLGYKVFSPKQILKSGATKVVISSFSFQDDIFCDLKALALQNIEIVRLYTNEDLLTFIKRNYAYCPKSNEIRPGLLKNRSKYLKAVSKGSHPKVLLIQAPFSFGNHRHKKILPMNHLYLGSYLLQEQENVGISILDGQVHDLSIEEMKALIKTEEWDIIGIGYWTAQATSVFELSRFIKESSDALLVHGGVHPTICPEESVKHCDLVVMNEGEETFAKIVAAFSEKKSYKDIPGISYLKNEKQTTNTPNPPREDLDDFPFPAFHLIPDVTAYNAPMHVTGGLRVPLIGSRGCPYSCTFCSSPIIWDKKVRWRSPENVVDEMEFVVKTLGITQFHFWDDNVMMKRSYIKKISEEILSRKLDINWCGLTRASHVTNNEDILPLMKEAGCVGIEIGIESFTEDSSDLIEKGEGVQEMIKASHCMENAGIAPLYTHMLFNPGENINGYREKQKFLNEVNKKNSAFLADSRLGQSSTPHKKTKFAQEATDAGEVYLKDHSTYVHHRINFIPYSLLEDIPEKTSEERGEPIKFLETILQAIFDWDENMIETYLLVSSKIWFAIDGKSSVQEISDKIQSETTMELYHSRIYTCLYIVGLAREGKIISVPKKNT